MTTNISLADSLPRDAGGAKFAAWIDVATSQLDMSLPAGIGSRTVSSKIVSALQVGTHIAGSRIERTGGVGVALMGYFASAVSATALENAIHIRSDDRGQLYSTQIAAATCVATGSTNLMLTSSGILMRFVAAGCGVIAGAQMAILNGVAGAATSMAHVVFSGANETVSVDFGPGACFGALRYELRGSVGTGYGTALFKQYGQ